MRVARIMLSLWFASCPTPAQMAVAPINCHFYCAGFWQDNRAVYLPGKEAATAFSLCGLSTSAAPVVVLVSLSHLVL
jgi:hypothetical protein